MSTETNTEVKTTKTVTPKLRCIVTGVERITSRTQLERRVKRTNGDVEKYLARYISRDALRLLRAGKSLEETRKELNSTETAPIDQFFLQEAIRINGKWSQEAEAEVPVVPTVAADVLDAV